ncbi:MAG: hypothetical protein ACRD8W_03545 [Nitrososphaeraceae archaeon]
MTVRHKQHLKRFLKKYLTLTTLIRNIQPLRMEDEIVIIMWNWLMLVVREQHQPRPTCAVPEIL